MIKLVINRKDGSRSEVNESSYSRLQNKVEMGSVYINDEEDTSIRITENGELMLASFGKNKTESIIECCELEGEY